MVAGQGRTSCKKALHGFEVFSLRHRQAGGDLGEKLKIVTDLLGLKHEQLSKPIPERSTKRHSLGLEHQQTLV